jgi:hypothetical protein
MSVEPDATASRADEQETLARESAWLLRWVLWVCAVIGYGFAIKAAVLWVSTSRSPVSADGGGANVPSATFWANFAAVSLVLSVATTVAALRTGRGVPAP